MIISTVAVAASGGPIELNAPFRTCETNDASANVRHRAHGRADGGQDQAFFHEQTPDAFFGCAERQPQTDLRHAARHQIAEEPKQADGREQQRDQSECRREPGEQPFLQQLDIELRVGGAHVGGVFATLGIDRAAHRLRHPARLARRPHQQQRRLVILTRLPEVQIDDGRHITFRPEDARVGRDADHRRGAHLLTRHDPQLLPQRIPLGKCFPRQRLAHNHVGRTSATRDAEVDALQQRNTERLEVAVAHDHLIDRHRPAIRIRALQQHGRRRRACERRGIREADARHARKRAHPFDDRLTLDLLRGASPPAPGSGTSCAVTTAMAGSRDRSTADRAATARTGTLRSEGPASAPSAPRRAPCASSHQNGSRGHSPSTRRMHRRR